MSKQPRRRRNVASVEFLGYVGMVDGSIYFEPISDGYEGEGPRASMAMIFKRKKEARKRFEMVLGLWGAV